MDSDYEIQRLRDWRHEADATLLAFKWRIEQLEKIVRELGPKLDRMARSDEIADAVAERVRGDRRVKFTRWQTVFGLIATAAAVADTIAHLPHG